VRTVGRCAGALSEFFRTAAGRIRWNITRSNSQLHATAAAAANIVAKTSPARFSVTIMARLLRNAIRKGILGTICNLLTTGAYSEESPFNPCADEHAVGSRTRLFGTLRN
jgi:hypothetical protein